MLFSSPLTMKSLPGCIIAMRSLFKNFSLFKNYFEIYLNFIQTNLLMLMIKYYFFLSLYFCFSIVSGKEKGMDIPNSGKLKS